MLVPAVIFLEPDPLYQYHFVIPAYPRHLTMWLPGFMTQPAMYCYQFSSNLPPLVQG